MSLLAYDNAKKEKRYTAIDKVNVSVIVKSLLAKHFAGNEIRVK